MLYILYVHIPSYKSPLLYPLISVSSVAMCLMG